VPHLKVEGATLHYEIDDFTDPWKSVPTVLLHHAAMGNAERWRAWVPTLARHYRVARLDMRGHGRSSVPPPDEPWSIERLARDARDLVVALGGAPVHFVGASAGGSVGLRFAHDFPELTRSLTLLATSPRMARTRVDYGEWLERVRRHGVRGFLASDAASRFSSDADPGLIAWFAATGGITPEAVVTTFVPYMAGLDLRELLPGIRAPVLLLAADRDPITPIEVERELQSQLPDARLVVYPATGHNIAEELADRCAAEALAFIRQVDRDRAKRKESPVASPTAPTANPYLPVREEWLSRWREEILEPDLPIVDPHHHLWDRPGWRYLLDELLADLNSGHRVAATVFVQCRAMHRAAGPEALRPVGETEFVNGVAAMSASGIYGPTRVCAGIVGHADLRLGDRVQEVLEAHLRAGAGRFRGIRHIVAWDADPVTLNPNNPAPPGLLADRVFRAGFARLAPLSLSFDAWLFHPQIPELTDLARAFPDTAIVLNHVGGPLGIGRYAGRRDEVFAAWRAAIRDLAGCPNVAVKVGGMGMRINGFGFEQAPEPPSSEALAGAWRPYVETCLEAFGPSRCMFESNFPVDKGSYPYAAYWNACKRLTSSASAGEKADLFRDTAARFYRLPLSD
jgi:pimeloyl-ACP methyl ester carboxylesterase/predicted TIM-barrel fold metal-dependent hydrolase